MSRRKIAVGTNLSTAQIEVTERILIELRVERIRQATVKGYDHAHDDAHDGGELARAAAVFAALDLPGEKSEGFLDWLLEMWPFTGEEPSSEGHRANLVRAGAMLVAEIERLDRAAAL